MGGTLFQQYHQSMIWLKSILNVLYDFEGEGGKARKELWEIPEIVFKEAIINSLDHRDYYDKGGRITIELFNDRVEVTNPCGLISSIAKNEFGKKSSCRNPLILGLFERMRLVEQIGSGISRMRDLMKEEGLTQPELNTNGMFTVTFRRTFDFEMWVNNLSEKQVVILKAIHENQEVKKSTLQQLTDFSGTAIDNNLEILKKEGLLEREGTKGGVWIYTILIQKWVNKWVNKSFLITHYLIHLHKTKYF
jgi:ATP-dependent DNA helicase RecG